MNNINTYFFNFWTKTPDGGPLKKNLNALGYDIVTDKSAPPQMVISSVYGNLDWISEFPKAIKILYSSENLYYPHYKRITDHLNAFDYMFSFCNYENFERWVRLPSFYHEHNIFDRRDKYEQIVNNKFDISNKTKNVCLVSRNPHKLRLDILEKLSSRNIRVDCPGAVGKNMPQIAESWEEKIQFISEYYIHICPENSYLEDYITEKLLHASLANCIPVYWGCEHLEYGVFNKEKILLINKHQSNLDDIISEIEELVNNPEYLQKKCSLPPFNTEIFKEQFDKIDQNVLKVSADIISRLSSSNS